jgi:hypothetical protein
MQIDVCAVRTHARVAFPRFVQPPMPAPAQQHFVNCNMTRVKETGRNALGKNDKRKNSWDFFLYKIVYMKRMDSD